MPQATHAITTAPLALPEKADQEPHPGVPDIDAALAVLRAARADMRDTVRDEFAALDRRLATLAGGLGHD